VARRIAPRRFNPERGAWLPILHTQRGRRHYTLLFSNTALAHRLRRSRDWVVVYLDDDGREDQWTIVTETRGALTGRRVVRGREPECRAHYDEDAAGLPSTSRPGNKAPCELSSPCSSS
jgi:putative hydrolase